MTRRKVRVMNKLLLRKVARLGSKVTRIKKAIVTMVLTIPQRREAKKKIDEAWKMVNEIEKQLEACKKN